MSFVVRDCMRNTAVALNITKLAIKRTQNGAGHPQSFTWMALWSRFLLEKIALCKQMHW